MSWLMLAALGMIWAAFLLPHERGKASRRTVEDFEKNMELLAETGRAGQGRWIVTPQKGTPFIGSRARAQQRARERRRRVFVVMLESIGITLLIGLVPPLRAMWYATGALLLLLAVYVWLLLWLKDQHPSARALEQNRLVRVPDAATPTPAPSRYVADASSRTPRAAFNGLTLDGDDVVNIVVRPARQVQPARA
ncbi:MAG TPA: hypothetical protein VFT27_11315 [Actinomycetota bacterium]|nr:hypothetical protein [Actinomycetota bacterium]